MLNYQEEQELMGQGRDSPFRMATVISYTTTRVKVRFDGEEEESTKEFQRLYGVSLLTGGRALCIRYGGTYIVLGMVS